MPKLILIGYELVHLFHEQVSHHPMLIACHCEGKGWKFWGDSNLRSKFWARSIQLDPVGILTLEFDDGEIFQWSKVCYIYIFKKDFIFSYFFFVFSDCGYFLL